MNVTPSSTAPVQRPLPSLIVAITPTSAEPPGAEADLRDLHARAAEWPMLHVVHLRSLLTDTRQPPTWSALQVKRATVLE
jgi:hypothetical protein